MKQVLQQQVSSDMAKVQIFGDSHVKYFEPSKYVRPITNIELEVYKIPASSIMGLGRKRSTLKTHEKINNYIDNNAISVFAFGQVDLELGYYYKKIIKNENTNHDIFISSLIEN